MNIQNTMNQYEVSYTSSGLAMCTKVQLWKREPASSLSMGMIRGSEMGVTLESIALDAKRVPKIEKFDVRMWTTVPFDAEIELSEAQIYCLAKKYHTPLKRQVYKILREIIS